MGSARSSSGATASSRLRAAAICAPGLEDLCRAELSALGCRPRRAGPGVATFRATDFYHLQDHAASIDWGRWIPAGHAPRFRISTNESKLYHTKAIAQRLHQVSAPPSIGEPEQLFVVRIDRNTVTLSADSSGPALHRRPWRTETGPAPLRPNLAAAVVLATDWDPTTDLVDPFCGSGTIGIEAALLARGLPPGGEREFAFHHWPTFEPGSWASVVASIDAMAERAAESGPPGPILLADRDDGAVSAARANAERAGVADGIEFAHHVVSHLKARPGPGLVVTNPPYGRRLGRAELTGLYGRLGAVVRERLPGHGLALLTTDADLARAADRRLRSRLRFANGGLTVQLFQRPPPDLASRDEGAEEPAVESAGNG